MSAEQQSPESQVESAEEKLVTEPESVDVVKEEVVDLSVDELVKKLALAEQKATENWDKALRIQAEMENLKRRTQKDLENAHKFALEKFSKELLSVMDSLELGIQASNAEEADVAKLREGSELTLKQFETVFAKFEVVAVGSEGEVFNPEFHQAMSIQPSDEQAPNTVMTVFQKGYTLNGRLIRPAMVVVSKAVDA